MLKHHSLSVISVSAEWRRTVGCGAAAQVFMVHQTNLHQKLDSNRENKMTNMAFLLKGLFFMYSLVYFIFPCIFALKTSMPYVRYITKVWPFRTQNDAGIVFPPTVTSLLDYLNLSLLASLKKIIEKMKD